MDQEMGLRLVAPPSGSPESSPAGPSSGQAPTLPPLEALFRRYSGYVAAVAMRLMGRDDEVDDIIQEVFLIAVRGIGDVADPAAIRGWLATVTVRTARKRLRMRRMRGMLGLDTPRSYEDVAAPGASPEERAMLARVYAALDRVPVNQRLAWTLRNVEGEALDQVAARCGCSLATVKRWIAAAHAVVEKAVVE
jgi:RNA polymerase sigma-70 factor (ECF subfamily)